MSDHVVLVLGAGANVGLSVVKKFAAQGWKVAAVARSVKDEMKSAATLAIAADFADPESVSKVFDEVESKLGTPNVVVYNPFFGTFSSGDDPVAGISVSEFEKGLAINATSPFAAAKRALAGFRTLPASAPKVFIYTGNMMSGLIVPEVVTLGCGKNSTLYVLEAAAHAYGKEAQFYFADERLPTGGSTMDKIGGAAHAEAYWELANAGKQLPVNYTFVYGKGYVKFDVDRIRKVVTMGELMEDAAQNYVKEA